MARASRLKVYRTPIGFHDAYVAAPNQKAALKAWGSDVDLFARGIAEAVDDPELMRDPLATPGSIVRRPRGTTAEQFAALPPDAPKRPRPRRRTDDERPSPRPKKPPKKPRPSRAALDDAEAAIADTERAHEAERARIAEEEKRLARHRREIDDAHRATAERLAKRRDAAQRAYDRAMRAWRG